VANEDASGPRILLVVLVGFLVAVVLLILGIVAAVALVFLAGFGSFLYLGQALDAEFAEVERSMAEMELQELESTVELYILENGAPPATLDDLDRLVGTDVWGTPYVYRVDGETFEITSLGSDGAPGGTGSAADLTVSGP
jgi:general secretion pathway protein G